MSVVAKDRVTLSGVGLETRWIGPAPDQAPTIVMLHDELGCVRLWGDFPSALAGATGCGVSLYSRAGYGASDPIPVPRPLTYLHHEALEILPELLDLIGFRRGILLGHGDGAAIATIYAGGVEDHRVRGLVLFAPRFFVEDSSVASIERAAEAYRTGTLRERLARYHGTNVDSAFHGWSSAWLDPAFRSWDIREHLAYVRVPILIVRGDRDEFGTEAQLRAADEEAYCPVEVTRLGRSGHAPHQDQPKETIGAVAGFVRRLMEDHEEARSRVTASGSGREERDGP